MKTLRIGFTSVDWEFISWRIRAASGGKWSHCLMLFHRDDGPDYYYESLSGVDKVTGKNGVRGPKAYNGLLDWERSSERHHLGVSAPLPLSDAEVEGVEHRVAQAVGKIGYAYLHCMEDLLAVKTGLAITRARKLNEPDNAWNCSETIARCMPIRLWPSIGFPDTIADWVVPSGPVLPSIETMCTRLGCPISVVSSQQV